MPGPEEETQLQTGETQPEAQPETPSAEQVAETPVAVQPEAVPEPAKPEKTYTQKERQEWEAAKDKEIAQHRQAIAQVAMELQVRDIRHAEELAQARDMRAVDSGEITEEQAVQKRQERYAGIQQRLANRQAAQQNEAVMQQRMQAAQTVLSRAEEAGRILAATDLAKEHGIDAKELLSDASLTDYEKMENKALKLALKAFVTKPEKFDSGQTTGAGILSEEQELKARFPTMFRK